MGKLVEVVGKVMDLEGGVCYALRCTLLFFGFWSGCGDNKSMTPADADNWVFRGLVLGFLERRIGGIPLIVVCFPLLATEYYMGDQLINWINRLQDLREGRGCHAQVEAYLLRLERVIMLVCLRAHLLFMDYMKSVVSDITAIKSVELITSYLAQRCLTHL